MSGSGRRQLKLYLGLIAVAVAGFVLAVGTDRKKAPDRVTGSCADTVACRECREKATAKFCNASYIAPQASDNIKVNGAKGCCGFETRRSGRTASPSRAASTAMTAPTTTAPSSVSAARRPT